MDALHRITPALSPGDRVVVRYRLSDAKATDALGWLVRLSEDAIELRDHLGSATVIGRATVVAARRLPVARRGRDPLRTSPAQLQQVALHGWRADSEPLGDWTLRAAGGFTGRANSCLAVGDPGVPMAEAAARIIGYADRRGARPWAQVLADSPEEDGLRALGWRQVHVPTDVLVARLADLVNGTEPDPRVHVNETLSAAWQEAYQVSRPDFADPAVIRRVLDLGAPRAFGGVTEPGPGAMIAIGRGHVREDWLGVAAVWTAPAHRRQGWATAILVALGHWAARRGARSVYLQVAADNVTAQGMYERLRLRHHHTYRYLAGPSA